MKAVLLVHTFTYADPVLLRTPCRKEAHAVYPSEAGSSVGALSSVTTALNPSQRSDGKAAAASFPKQL